MTRRGRLAENARCKTGISSGAAFKVANRDSRLVERYTFVAVVRSVVSFGLSTLVKQLQSRIAILR